MRSNVSICYKGKRLLITKSTSFSELQNHQTPMVKPGLANLYNNFGRNLSDSRQLTTSLSYTIGNNKRENSLRKQSYLSAAKTTQTRENAFKILITIDNLAHVYLTIVFYSLDKFLLLPRENHKQLKCYHHKELLSLAPNKGAFTKALSKFYSQETSQGVHKAAAGHRECSLH